MQRMTGLALAVLAGCGFTPGSLAIDAGDTATGDVARDGQIVGDPDGDGLLGAADNCPLVANANQLDHDTDAHGDACDRCPHLPSSSDPDVDGDGVGDDCDPRPAVGGDAIVLFEGFYDSTTFSTWIEEGAWSVSDGVLTQTDPDDNFAYVVPSPTFTVARAALTVGARIVELGMPRMSDEPTVAIYTGTVGTSQGYLCSVRASGGAVQAQVYSYWEDQDSNLNDGTVVVWPGMLAANSELRMTDAHDGAGHHCTLSQGTITTSLTALQGPTSGNIALITELVSASFDYVFVVNAGL